MKNISVKISVSVKNEWEVIVRENLPWLRQSRDLDEICERLETLKFRGVGGNTIVRTGEAIADFYDIPRD
ncbi:MAG: hypothetical protein E7137_00460 [Rikenellaceae bacterium]|nr:hypothetical protein [Rikenellaceae bacterium]